MKINQPLVTIIVPIYDVERYLRRCVDSVLEQTYSNLEIILVDDGSPDKCGVMCDGYARQDKRVKVIHKENGGLSDARNAAIDVAAGDYLFMLDSDDYIAPDTIEFLLKSVTECDSQIATCMYVNHYNDDFVLREDIEDNVAKTLCAEDALRDLLYQAGVTTSAWGKLYAKELFADGIRYPFGKICEDLPTTYKLFAKSQKITINSAVKVYYQQRADSIIKSSFKPARMDALGFAKDQLEFMKKRFPELEEAAINRYFMEAIYIFDTLPFLEKDVRGYYETLWEVIARYRGVVLRDRHAQIAYARYAARWAMFGSFGLKIALRARTQLGRLIGAKLRS